MSLADTMSYKNAILTVDDSGDGICFLVDKANAVLIVFTSVSLSLTGLLDDLTTVFGEQQAEI